MTAADLALLTPQEQQHLYFSSLFQSPGGFIDHRAMFPDGSVTRRALSSIRAVEGLLANGNADGCNQYVGTATRISNSVAPGAGGKDHLHTTHVIWVDVDFEREGDAEALDAVLKTFPIPPSMRVASGNGEHIYWVIEPFDLSSAANRARFEQILKGLADYLHADRAATDSSRVMRVPGTTNYPDAKKRAKGRTEVLAVLLEHHSDRVYHIDDFESFEQRGKALATEKNFTAYAQPDAFDPGVLPEWVETLLEKKQGRLRKRWDGATDGLKDTSASGFDQSIADLLALERDDGPGIEQALRFRRAKAGADPKHAIYYQKTVGLALDWAAKQRDANHEVISNRVRGHVLPAQKPKGPVLVVVPDPAQDSGDDKPTSVPLEDATDAGLAAVFLRLYGSRLLHRPVRGDRGWYVWDEARFRCDDGNDVRRLMRQIEPALLRQASDTRDKKHCDELLKMANRSRSRRAIDAALWVAAADSRVVVRLSDLDADGWLFNVQNGTINLHTGELREHRREDRLTRVSPVLYDRDATAPLFKKFLEQIQPQSEMRRFLQRAMGYSMTGDTTEECLFICYGGGANGKTTLIEGVRAVFGSDYAVELSPSALTINRNAEDLDLALSPLLGARLATTTELRDNQKLNEQSVKKICSGEPVRARQRYHDSFEFCPNVKLWTATNHKPTVSGDDDGIWRRLRLILFDQKFEGDQINRNLRAELREELPGILNWAIEGCLAWQQGGLSPPQSVIDATQDYRDAEDQIAGFFDECCEETPDLWVSTGDIRSALAAWCKTSGAYVPSTNTLTARLRRRGFVAEKRARKRGWRGLTLTEEARSTLHAWEK